MLKLHNRLISLLVFISVFVLSLMLSSTKVLAIGLSNRFVRLSDSNISVAATHLLGFNYTDTVTPVGSVAFEFCSNDPIINSPCTAPNGFDASNAALVNQTGFGGFIIDSIDTTANRLVITRGLAAAPSAGPSTYQFDNVINPDAAGSYYIRVSTHASLNATGAPIEWGGVVFAILAPFNITTEVPPYLIFCAAITITNFDCSSATTYAIDFGDFSSSSPSSASSQLVVATNAGLGYSISLNGTTLTSGSNIIPALSSPTPSNPGTSQFGINLRANTVPPVGADPTGSGSGVVSSDYNTPNQYKFVNGDSIASSPSTSDNNKFTISYLVNVNDSQPAGYYATTISYICLANF